jgi:hypothetical protein
MESREWLLAHLEAQAAHLLELTRSASQAPDDTKKLIPLRDEIFTFRETLDTLGVSLALSSNADWNREIGTTFDDGS